MRIKVQNKIYKMREGAQCIYELIALELLLLLGYGLFYKMCEFIAFIAKEVM